jgi:type VI secretion system protein ImpB
MSNSGQKFIARNRAPRVQIEYDVELFGSEKKVQLPFVMGVMSDLSGSPKGAAGAGRRSEVRRVLGRQLRRSAQGHPAAGGVPGSQHLDRRGKSRRGPHLRKHGRLLACGHCAQGRGRSTSSLQARQQLSNLITYMDGRTGAEDLIANALRDPALLQALASAPKAEDGKPEPGKDK